MIRFSVTEESKCFRLSHTSERGEEAIHPRPTLLTKLRIASRALDLSERALDSSLGRDGFTVASMAMERIATQVPAAISRLLV